MSRHTTPSGLAGTLRYVGVGVVCGWVCGWMCVGVGVGVGVGGWVGVVHCFALYQLSPTPCVGVLRDWSH